MCTRLENAIIQKYGFESKITVAVFRLTALIKEVTKCEK